MNTQERRIQSARDENATLRQELQAMDAVRSSLQYEVAFWRQSVAHQKLLMIVVFFTGLLRDLPLPVLAAVVLVAVTGLVKVDVLRHIWRFNRSEFAVAVAALPLVVLVHVNVRLAMAASPRSCTVSACA